MSFTVSQRTREIGLRVALGAQRRSVLVAVLGHAMTQVAIGVVVGVLAFVALIVLSSDGGTTIPAGWGLPIAGYGVVMLLVCMLAALVPTRRALSVEPTEALRADFR
jgi:putative ABC transport system permease protein